MKRFGCMFVCLVTWWKVLRKVSNSCLPMGKQRTTPYNLYSVSTIGEGGIDLASSLFVSSAISGFHNYKSCRYRYIVSAIWLFFVAYNRMKWNKETYMIQSRHTDRNFSFWQSYYKCECRASRDAYEGDSGGLILIWSSSYPKIYIGYNFL